MEEEEEDAFALPDDMDPALKRLSMHLLERVMSETLRDPARSKEELLAVVDRLAASLRTHWELA
ncbi:MAG: hypothetical protein ACRDJO_04490 [Actinomycetota bacterium]